MKHFSLVILGLILLLLYTGCPTEPPMTYSITYHANGATGGSVPTDTGSYQAGSQVTVKTNYGNLVKTGFTFSGWNSAANGSGTDYAESSTFSMPAANVVLYAKWQSDGQAYIQANLTVNLTDYVSLLGDDKSMTVKANANTTVDSYAWYLDGVLQVGETSATCTIDGSVLGLGHHHIAVFVAKGNSYSSASISFEVVEFLSFSYDFEDSAEWDDFFLYSISGTAEDWDRTNATAHTGSYSAVSGSIDPNDAVFLELYGSVPADYMLYEVSFWYKVSSELDYDTFTFETYDDYRDDWITWVIDSGHTDWKYSTVYPEIYEFSDYCLDWGYSIDENWSSGEDCAWVDDITVTFIKREGGLL
ncbi:MAG: InlB B-repeat-containing protein [Sphaerochaetaceae bacterium]